MSIKIIPGKGKVKLKTPSTNGLVGYWPFSEGSGTVAHDFSGNGNHGTLVNGPVWSGGIRGNGLSFNGTNQRVRTPPYRSLSIIGSKTFGAWIKQTQTGAEQCIIDRANGYALTIDSSNFVKIYIGAIVGNPFISSQKVKNNSWQHVFVVWDQIKVYIYINGDLVDSISAAGPQTISDDNLAIGAVGGVSGSLFWKGSIDEVRLYSRALSPAEISSLYQAGSFRIKTRNDQGLVGYWPFSEGSGTVAHDMSGNGNHGKMVSTVSWADGRIGKSLMFNGTSNAISIANSSFTNSVFASTNYSVSFWMFTSDLLSQKIVISDFYAGGTIGVRIQARANGVMWFILSKSDGTSNSGITNGVYETNRWIHWTMIQSGSNVFMYKDGILHRSGTVSSTYNSQNALNFSNLFGEPYIGLLDEVRLYNRPLSSQEVSDLYNSYI